VVRPPVCCTSPVLSFFGHVRPAAQRAIAVLTPAFAPVTRAIPGVRLGPAATIFEWHGHQTPAQVRAQLGGRAA
jgi:hypothetical protein